MRESRPWVPVLVGPTGIGKTAVVTAWAEHEAITVVSADARQVYRGLDVGTAKPPPDVRARVPHVGLDLIEPGERYGAGQFARDAAAWLEDIRATGATADLDRGAPGDQARALGSAVGSAVRGRRSATGRARHRGRVAHGTRPQLVAGTRARDRRAPPVVHSSDAAARRAGAPHRRPGGPDARGGVGG